MSVFRLLVRVSQHLWRQVPLSALPGGESLTSVLSCYAAISTLCFKVKIQEKTKDHISLWFIPVKLNQTSDFQSIENALNLNMELLLYEMLYCFQNL